MQERRVTGGKQQPRMTERCKQDTSPNWRLANVRSVSQTPTSMGGLQTPLGCIDLPVEHPVEHCAHMYGLAIGHGTPKA